MTALARLVAFFGIAFIVLFTITGSWYYALLAFFALAIVLPAAWTTNIPGPRRPKIQR
jgi:predicted membrane protein